MSQFSETYEPPTGGAPTSDAARPQGLGRLPINYLRLTSPTPRERSLTSPRLGQPLGAEGHQRSDFLNSMGSGTPLRISTEEMERQWHLSAVEEGMRIFNQPRNADGTLIYRDPDQLMTGAGRQYPGPPRVHWAEQIHTTTGPATDDEIERIAIRRNTRANEIKVSDAELARRAEDKRVPEYIDQNVGVRNFSAHHLRKDHYMRVHGRSCQIKSTSMHNFVIRIEVDLIGIGYTLKVRPSDLVSASFSPILDGAITASSAAMLVERDYTFLDGRSCMLTWVSLREASNGRRHMHVVGIDLETGEEVEARLPADTEVSIASRPVEEFVPNSLLGPEAATVSAASLMEGYHMVIEGRDCKIVCVRYPQRPCKESCWRQVRVVYMDSLSSTEDETVLRGVDLDMASMVTVGRNGIDPGPCDSTGGGNIIGHMSCADNMFNNVSF